MPGPATSVPFVKALTSFERTQKPVVPAAPLRCFF